MYQLFYISSATESQLKDFSFKDIAITSRGKNQKKNISGILLYHSGLFLQLLEGEKEDVEALFKIIESDPRHSNIVVLFRNRARKRVFEEWSMAYKEINKIDVKMINEIISWNKLISGAKDIDKNLILFMLQRFKKDLTLEVLPA